MRLTHFAFCLVSSQAFAFMHRHVGTSFAEQIDTRPSSPISRFQKFRFRPRMPLSIENSPAVPPSEPDSNQESSALTNSDTVTTKQKLFALYTTAASGMANLFPLWTVLFSAIALKSPSSFAWFTTEYFTAGLGLLMLSMGITLTVDDFKRVLLQPQIVATGFLGCYALMPALAYGIGKLCNLPVDLIAGMVLVGCINGGQASNLCAYIAKGDVALSVLMTTATTIGAIFMTPLLCKLILGTVVPMDAVGIAKSTIQVVLAPIVGGMFLNKAFPKAVKAVQPLTPVVGVISTCLLVASAVAQCAPAILDAGIGLQIPIILLHVLGGVAGYAVPKMMGFTETASRTMAIETSMKSSAFGFLLAKLHFSNYTTRVPSAVSVVWMALTGSIMAVIWKYMPVTDEGGKGKK